MKSTTLCVVLALSAPAFPAGAFGAPADKTQASTAHQDTEFVKVADQGNVNEIALAEVALKKSENADVKAFAQKMIDDHTKLSDSMAPFRAQAGLEKPSHADVSTLATKAKLELLSGTSFDKAYIKDMVEDHHKDLQDFMKEKQTTGYPALKEAVSKGETVIRGHLEDIDALAKKNGVTPAPIPSKA